VSDDPSAGRNPSGHGHPRMVAFLLALILLACLGTYWTTVTFTPLHSTAAGPGTNRTVIVYDNSTVFQNTTRNVTTPVFHNTTMWQNSTVYQNGTVYHTTTVYVNTTKVVMIPVVNITGFRWGFNSSGSFAGQVGANLVAPAGSGFNHSYPLGTVMWIVVNVTNYASHAGQLGISLASPFELVDSQPSVPHAIAALSTLTFEVSIGVPYVPGEYTLVMTVTVS